MYPTLELFPLLREWHVIPKAHSCPPSLHGCSLAGLFSCWRASACTPLECGACGAVPEPLGHWFHWQGIAYSCQFMPAFQGLFFQFHIKCFLFSHNMLWEWTELCFPELRSFSIKSVLDGAEPSLLQCGMHLGPVCDLLLLPTNAAWLLKVNLKILVLWLWLLYVSPGLLRSSHCCIKQWLIINNLIRRTYGKDGEKARIIKNIFRGEGFQQYN